MAHHYREGDEADRQKKERKRAAEQGRIGQHNIIIGSLNPEERTRYDLAVDLFLSFSNSAEGKKMNDSISERSFGRGVTP